MGAHFSSSRSAQSNERPNGRAKIVAFSLGFILRRSPFAVRRSPFAVRRRRWLGAKKKEKEKRACKMTPATCCSCASTNFPSDKGVPSRQLIIRERAKYGTSLGRTSGEPSAPADVSIESSGASLSLSLSLSLFRFFFFSRPTDRPTGRPARLISVKLSLVGAEQRRRARWARLTQKLREQTVAAREV